MNSSGFIFYIGSCLDRLCICIVQLDRLKLFSQIWVKASAEQQFLYGHHIMKSGLGRITENTPKWAFLKIWSLKFLPSSGTRVWSCTAWLTCPLGLGWLQKPPRSAGTRTPWTLLHSTRCRICTADWHRKSVDLIFSQFFQADLGEYIRAEETLL